jgi:hypothetical protein
MFDFMLHRQPFERIGSQPFGLRRHFTVDEKEYEFALDSRGYTFELKQPIPVMVTEGRIMGKHKRPIEAFLPKPGVDYSDGEEDNSSVASP